MKPVINIQSATRSQLDPGKLCSFDIEYASEDPIPLIHQDARFWFITGGSGKLLLQNNVYTLGPNMLVSVMPWQISDIIEISSPLQYTLIAYNYDAVTRAAKIFSNQDGQTESFLCFMEDNPVVSLNGSDETIEYLIHTLSQELGKESTLPPSAKMPFHNIYVVSLLVQLIIYFIRLTEKQKMKPTETRTDYTEILRYIYLHCNEKLTLEKLSSLFYCSPSTISSYLAKTTGLSFFDLLNEIRIGKTINFIMYTDFTLKEMSEFLGYVDESHISKVFTARIGAKISEYRKIYQKVQNICRIEETRTVYTIINYIYRNYAEDLSPKDIAHQFGLSVSQLNELLLYQVEQNFSEFLNQVRVNRASELLLIPSKTVLEVAYEVGYKNPKTFTRNFLKKKGLTPQAFRQNYTANGKT